MERKRVSNLFLIVTFMLTFVFVNGDIRCHCNQPACVRTGYMCKSTGPQAACFVEHSGFVNVDRSSDISRHGCIEMLPIEERTPCLDQALDTFASQNGGYVRTNAHAHRHGAAGGHHHGHKMGQNHKSITCCLDDMCNYVKTIIKEEEESAVGKSEQKETVDGPWIQLKPRVSSKVDDIDSLGKHLQESYGVTDSLSHDGSLWFELLTFGIIMILLAVLVLLILFGVRFISQDDSHRQKSQTQLAGGRGYEQNCGSAPKRSMLDWKCFMSSKSANPHLNSNRQLSNAMLYGGKPSAASLYHQKCQTKQSLLLSVKVDLDSQDPMDHMTNLDDDLSQTNSQLTTSANLPNIICAHTLPPEKMTAQVEEQHLDNRAPMNASKFGRERQNSIYLSLLPPQSQPGGGQKNTNFDLISDSN